MKKIFKYIRLNGLVFLVVLIALFLRLFKISSYMTFLGDEGRDALVWLKMLKYGKFTLIGPQTSIGNMYLGPLYYYLMFPFYLLMGTTGSSIGVALFAGATTFLLWFVGKNWFSYKVGLLSALFYAISPVAIVLSRSSWNPNVMPFFSILIAWGIWEFYQNDKFYWLAIEGVLLSFAIQSHYLGILLMPVVGLFFVIKLISLRKKKDKKIKILIVNFALCTLNFALFTIVPLLWFDLRHNFLNYKSFYKFFTERQSTVNLKLYKAIPEIWPLWQNVITRLVGGQNVQFGFFTSIFLGAAVLFSVFHNRFNIKKYRPGSLILTSLLLVGIVGMGLYKQHIYDHYFGFLFPFIFLLTALVIEVVSDLNLFGFLFSLAFSLTIIFYSVKENPFKYKPNSQMFHTEEISMKIIKESGGKKFNLGMIAKQNYDAGYRYFLEKYNHPALEINPQKADQTIAEQLFVVCEDGQCGPTTHPQAEIANFGWSKIEKEWDYPWGAKLFKLVHNKD